jgi:glutamine synthetase
MNTGFLPRSALPGSGRIGRRPACAHREETPMSSPPSILERLPETFREWLAGRRVEEVECVIADVAGISRGKAMPYAKFMREERMFLPTSIFHQTIGGDYVDMEIANQWTESDMVLTPDYGTGTASPWADDVTLQVIHNVEDLSGGLLELKKQHPFWQIRQVFYLP